MINDKIPRQFLIQSGNCLCLNLETIPFDIPGTRHLIRIVHILRIINKLSCIFVAIIISAGVEVFAKEAGRESPFGAHGAFARPFVESDKAAQQKILHNLSEVREPYRYVQDIGIKWVRPGGDIYWPAVQPTPEAIKDGIFDWSGTDIFFGKVPQGVNILATIDALAWGVNVHPAFKPGTWQFVHEAAERDYIKFVKEVVERYDGDGYKDMPGLANPIKYWQIGNEPALRPLKGIEDANRELDWKGFSRLVEISYKAIKESDADAKVALAGLAAGYPPDYANDLFFRKMCLREREEFYIPLLENLQGRYIDIFDIHYYGVIEKDGSVRPEGWGWEGMKQAYDFFRRKLDENGYKNTEIWFTETATPSAPFGERFQAINLVKRFVYSLTFGVKKVFWWNMIEGEYPLEVDKPLRAYI